MTALSASPEDYATLVRTGIRQRVAAAILVLTVAVGALWFASPAFGLHTSGTFSSHAHTDHYHSHGDHWDHMQYQWHQTYGCPLTHEVRWLNQAHIQYFSRYFYQSGPC